MSIHPKRPFLFAFSLLVVGCGQPYSPYLMLPAEPLNEHDIQVEGGIGAVPTVSEQFAGIVNNAEVGLLRYGVSNTVTLQAETWMGSFPSIVPFGNSLAGIILLNNRTASWRYALVPRLAVMYSGGQVSGWGSSVTFASWTPKLFGIAPYLGAGILAGVGSKSYEERPINDSEYQIVPVNKSPLGLGGSFNAGLAYDIFKNVTLNAEFATGAIFIFNSPGDFYTNVFWVWGFGVGYRF